MRKNFPHLLLRKWLFLFFFFPSIPFISLSLLFSNEGALNWKEWPPPKRHGVCLEGHLFHNNTSFLSKALTRMKRDLLSIIPMLVKILLGIIPNTYPVLIYLETLHVKVLLRHPSAQSLRTLKITWYKDLGSRTLYLSLLTTNRGPTTSPRPKHMNVSHSTSSAEYILLT